MKQYVDSSCTEYLFFADVLSLTSTRSGTKFAGISYINYLFLIALLIKYQRVPMVCFRISNYIQLYLPN